MLKSNLNKKIFNKDVEKRSTREGYGEGLLELGNKDERVVALCADLTESTKTHLFANEFPERFVQVGVAEQNLRLLLLVWLQWGRFLLSLPMRCFLQEGTGNKLGQLSVITM